MSEYLPSSNPTGTIYNSTDFNYQDANVTLKNLHIILEDSDGDLTLSQSIATNTANVSTNTTNIANNTTNLTDITYSASNTTVANQLTINKLNANAYECPLGESSNVIIGRDSANISNSPNITKTIILGENIANNTLSTSAINLCTLIGGKNHVVDASSIQNSCAIGYQASEKATGSNNTAIGINCNRYNIGVNNICIGNWCGQGVTGVSNFDNCVMIGISAGFELKAGADFNTLIGNGSGQKLTTGIHNFFGGYNSSENVTTGHHNTSIGSVCGRSIVTSVANTFVGQFCGSGSTCGNSNVGVGANVICDGANSVCIGRYSQSKGDNNCAIGYNAGTSSSPKELTATDDNLIVLGDSNITDFYCKIGTINTSDRRDKIDIVSLDSYGLDFVNKLQPVTFRYNDRNRYVNRIETEEEFINKDGETETRTITTNETVENDGSRADKQTRLGFIAQDIRDCENECEYDRDTFSLVKEDNDGNNLGLRSDFNPIFVQCIQELYKEIQELKDRIIILES